MILQARSYDFKRVAQDALFEGPFQRSSERTKLGSQAAIGPCGFRPSLSGGGGYPPSRFPPTAWSGLAGYL